MAEITRPPLTKEQADRLMVLLKGKTTIEPGFPGLTEAEAVEAIMLLDGVREHDARFILAFARGEISGDVVEEADAAAAEVA